MTTVKIQRQQSITRSHDPGNWFWIVERKDADTGSSERCECRDQHVLELLLQHYGTSTDMIRAVLRTLQSRGMATFELR